MVRDKPHEFFIKMKSKKQRYKESGETVTELVALIRKNSKEALSNETISKRLGHHRRYIENLLYREKNGEQLGYGIIERIKGVFQYEIIGKIRVEDTIETVMATLYKEIAELKIIAAILTKEIAEIRNPLNPRYHEEKLQQAQKEKVELLEKRKLER